MIRNEKVKKNFCVINIIGNNILNEYFKIICRDIEAHRSITNCSYNAKNNFY